MSELKLTYFWTEPNSEITQILTFLEGAYFLIIELYLPRQKYARRCTEQKNRTTNKRKKT